MMSASEERKGGHEKADIVGRFGEFYRTWTWREGVIKSEILWTSLMEPHSQLHCTTDVRTVQFTRTSLQIST